MASLWVTLALAAAVGQLIRNLSQRDLVREKGPQHPALARSTSNAVRYWVGLPFALTAFLFLFQTSDLSPRITSRVLILVGMGGVFQIIGTDLLIRLFQRRTFGIGVAYQSSENLLAALVGPIGLTALFGLSVGREGLSGWDWLGLLLGTAGLITQSFLKLSATQRQFDGQSMITGLACGLFLAGAGVTLAEAVRALNLPLTHWHAAALAGVTILAINMAFQSIVMAIWTQVQCPSDWRLIPRRWRTVLLTGASSFFGSMCLFIAFGLAHPALVSTVRQVDIPLSILVAYLVFRERPQRVEWIGMALILVAVVLIAVF